MGAHPAGAYWRAVVPGIAPSYFSNVLYLLETNVRHSAILGYVGAGGIGLLLNEKISWLEYSRVGMILLLLFLTVCIIEGISSLLSQMIREERRLSRREKRALTGAAVFPAAGLHPVPPAAGFFPHQPADCAGHGFRPAAPRTGPSFF